MKTCVNCKFATPVLGDPRALECRRYPPVQQRMGEEIRARNPVVSPEHSCGEFKEVEIRRFETHL